MKRRPGPSTDESLDTLFQGRLAVIQRKGGYRFSLDAPLLAHFVRLAGKEKIVDLGTGNGVIPLILASLYPSVHIIGLDIQKEMVERALKGADFNQLRDRVEFIHGDVCSIEKIFPPRSFDVVVCNPPYRAAKSGRMNPDPERRIARHEIKAGLGDFLRAAFYLLRSGGRIALIYPATRIVDLLHSMRGEKVEPKRLRLVCSFEGDPASLVLVEGIKEGKIDLKIMAPLVVYTSEKKYTSEVGAILTGGSRRLGWHNKKDTD
jgi:tRNA1Val (adenine37-N6)-methyltransferase